MALKWDGNQTLWNAIFNNAAPHIDAMDRNKCVASSKSTKELGSLRKIIKENEQNMRISNAHAAIYVWLRCIAAVLKVDQRS